ncbi:acyl-CoA N-acyltransferase [Pyronema domesticum]|uniref:Similar to N-alpha-acetyltransferase 50 acc. no. Q6DBY2 n=1 Tax=Pyronema omphalodes (strain CBS 100304) TaxID=1076935 RepID=U4KYG9_PYROM|nr:acyl-CoA N-acyltransferase [Pyronema domesticum]CCX07021.1 Similar to N-alpha-acetyltransferase 50; acc. no. Q6DBY2 [Pyronema omphalodes CBS 100304]
MPPSKLTTAPSSSGNNIAALKRLNSLLLPVAYKDSFYKEIVSSPSLSALSRVASWGETVVGGICARYEADTTPSRPLTTTSGNGLASSASSTSSSTSSSGASSPGEGMISPTGIVYNDGKIYIMTLCVLSPFRNLGAASALLKDVVETAKSWGIREVYAHVWTENHEALEWYGKRGFVVEEEVIKGYYRKLRPDGARIVKLMIPRE